MSILDPQETVCNRAEIACQWDNPLHPNISDSEYESLRRVYYPIRNLYQWFFAEFCSDEDLDLVNANVVAELTRCGVFTSLPLELYLQPRTNGILSDDMWLHACILHLTRI